MRKFLFSPLGPDSRFACLKYTMGICLAVFACLQIWRPYFFLTDDNLSVGWPLLTEIGRQIKAGQAPFIDPYLLGGNYDLSRDISIPFWHPFYFLPALFADTAARYAIMDVTALLLLLLAAAGFTLLAQKLVREFNPGLPVIYLLFYMASWVFSSFMLMAGSGWMQFLGNQSALPWLALGILDRKLSRGTALVLLFSIHEVFSSYAPSTLVNGLCLFLFAGGIALIRRSATPICSFIFGNTLTVLLGAPYLLRVLGGFLVSARAGGMVQSDLDLHAIPPALYPFSFFAGNWSGPAAVWGGIKLVDVDNFPYLSVLLACAAAWCLLPAVVNSRRWRGIELTCATLITLLFILTIRPPQVTNVMSHIVILRSMRWPFREALQLLFFVHLFLLIRPQGAIAKWEGATAIFSVAMFLLPIPFDHPPTFNALTQDRMYLLSGRAERYWAGVKRLIKPTDDIATIIPVPLWKEKSKAIPYIITGTADFPAYLQVKCISAYAPTVPLNQMPLKIPISYWFGAFDDTQEAKLLQARPGLKIIEVTGADPLRLDLLSDGKRTDLTPYLGR